MTRSNTRPLVAFLAVCGVVAAAGGALAVRGITSDGSVSVPVSQRTAASAAHSGPHGVGDDVLTSFGAVSVDVAKKLPGLTSKAVSGVTHYPSYIPPDKMMVQITVSVTNLTPAIMPLESSKLFKLVSGDGKDLTATTNTLLKSMKLQPSASVEGIMGFVIPAKGQKLQVRVVDPNGATQLVQIGKATADPTGRISATPLDHDDNHSKGSERP